MKKVYLFIAFLGLSATIFSQNATFQIFDVNGNNVTNGVYNQPALHSGDNEAKFYVKNTGSQVLSLKISRDNIQMPSGVDNFLCFGVTCFPASANVTTFANDIQPSVTDSSFHGLYRNDNNVSGDFCITYIFFDDNNPDNTATVRVYNGACLTASIDENEQETFSVSAYPNPAFGSVSIKYNVSSESQLIISDITGKTIKNIRLNANSQSTQVDISDLKAGIYIYSIQTGAKKIISKKLVVR